MFHVDKYVRDEFLRLPKLFEINNEIDYVHMLMTLITLKIDYLFMNEVITLLTCSKVRKIFRILNSKHAIVVYVIYK